jgi:filamentous hemagglutinin family protein
MKKRLSKLCASLLVLAALVSSASALPEGSQIMQGQANISSNSNSMNIDQLTQRVDIDWKSFNIKQNELVKFNQPNSQSIAINRVVNSTSASFIDGLLKANGKVAVFNDAGIIITKTGKINTGAFIASTAKKFSVDKNGKFEFGREYGKGDIINDGLIQVAKDSEIVLVGGNRIINNGYIDASGGTVSANTGST